MADDADLHEFRIFGGPGCGKTSALAASVERRVREAGPTGIMIASFTRAAAAEIAGRNLPIDKSSVGTLHALAYRALDRPQLVVERLHEWNRLHSDMPMSTSYVATLDEMAPADSTGGTEGDRLVNEAEILRARRIDPARWPTHVQRFWAKWSTWKTNQGLLDFTDLIETALESSEPAPGNPRVMYLDEAQDFTPLELALARKWGQGLEQVTVVGDDDQVLYSFKGATPDAFLNPPIPDDRKWVLPQSHRLPRAVHEVAAHWIEQVAHREPKQFLPRDADGSVSYAEHLTYTEPGGVVKDVGERLDAGRSVMVLATCAYMLDPLKKELKKEGRPFSNVWRRSRTDWNPLAGGRGVSSAQRLLAYLILDRDVFGEASHGWTGEDVRRWTAMIKKQGIFRRGIGAVINGLPDRELDYSEVASLFDSEVELAQAVAPSLAWFKANLLGSTVDRMRFPITVAERRGPLALTTEPRLTIGTVHSVKGAESDDVLVFPDLSMSGLRELSRMHSRDSVIRQMYVAMTRARENLVITGNASQIAVPTDALLGGGLKG